MAQLRCAQTSELLAEGTPLEIAHLAAEIGEDEVIFDDVGYDDHKRRSTFDAAAVRKRYADEIAGLERSLAEELPARAPAGADKDDHKRRREGVQAAIAERKERVDAGRKMAAKARKLMGEARERVEQRRRAEA